MFRDHVFAMHNRAFQSRVRTRDRRAAVYIAVLGVALVVGVMATVAMTLVRVERRIDSFGWKQREARMLAQSAVEYAVLNLQEQSGWRSGATAITSGAETAPVNFGSGTISWQITDSDGNFANDLQDVITAKGIGRVGESVFVEQVQLMPTGAPLSCLEAAACVRTDINAGESAIVNGSGLLSANGDIDGSNATFDIDVETASEVEDGIYTRTVTEDTPARELPNTNVLTYYKSTGTWIPIASISLDGSTREIRGQLISAARNPYGRTNPEGVYVVDCMGETLIVEQSRIVGTLVLLNPGAGSGITSSALLEPAAANYPALLVDGNFTLSTSTGNVETLSEATAGINLNPADTPYNGGDDSDIADVVPSKLVGLVYVSGTTTCTGYTTIDGCLVTGALQVNDSVRLRLNYDDQFLRNPPPGFAAGDPMEIIPGTWQRVAY